MSKQFSPEELRQYADGELPAELLAQYPVAKQPRFEIPQFSNRTTLSSSQNSVWRTRRRWLIRVFMVVFGACVPYMLGYFMLPSQFDNSVCRGQWFLFVMGMFLISLFLPNHESESTERLPFWFGDNHPPPWS